MEQEPHMYIENLEPQAESFGVFGVKYNAAPFILMIPRFRNEDTRETLIWSEQAKEIVTINAMLL
jgi:hypothetical protein